MKVLLIRFKMIGDVLLTSAVAECLRYSVPNAEIDFLTYDTSAPLFEHGEVFSRVFALTKRERSNPASYFCAIWRITRRRYDVIIDATGTTKSAFVSRLSPHAEFKISRHKNRWFSPFTHELKSAELPINKIDERLALLGPLKEKWNIELVNRFPTIAVTNAEQSRIRRRLEEAGVDFDAPLFALAASSREEHKSWPLECMFQVAQQLHARFGAILLLIAGLDHEREVASQLQLRLHNAEVPAIQIEIRDLRELFSALSQCDLFVGNEGGPRHFAAAVGVPTVSVVSPSASKREWLSPDSERHIAIEWRDVDPQAHAGRGSISVRDDQYDQLYGLIKPEHVLQAVRQVLAATPKQQCSS